MRSIFLKRDHEICFNFFCQIFFIEEPIVWVGAKTPDGILLGSFDRIRHPDSTRKTLLVLIEIDISSIIIKKGRHLIGTPSFCDSLFRFRILLNHPLLLFCIFSFCINSTSTLSILLSTSFPYQAALVFPSHKCFSKVFWCTFKVGYESLLLKQLLPSDRYYRL